MFVLRAEIVTIFGSKMVTISACNTIIYKICKLRKAIFSVFYNVYNFNKFFTGIYFFAWIKNQGPRNRGGAIGACPPPLFLKVKKVPFFLGLNAPFKERKKYFLNKRPLFLERKCPFRSSKDSVKAISDVIETAYFQKISFGS